MSIKTIGDGFIQITGIGTSATATIVGGLTVNGNVNLPSNTNFGGSPLSTIASGSSSTMDTDDAYIESDPTVLTIPFSENASSTSYSASLSVDAFIEDLPKDPFIEYTFGTNADTSGNSQNLTLAPETIVVPDAEKGHALLLKTSDGWSITKSSLLNIPQTTVIAPNGTGLTISFDLLFISSIYENYNLLQIGRSFYNGGWDNTVRFTREQARGITFSIGKTLDFYVMYVDEDGKYMQACLYRWPSITLNKWMHIDIVISPQNSIRDRPATVHIDGIPIQSISSTHYWVNNPEPTPDQHSEISSLQFDGNLTNLYFQGTPNGVKIANFQTWLRELSADELAVLNKTNQITTLVPQVYARNISNVKCRFMDRSFGFINVEQYYDKLKVGCVLSQDNKVILSKNIDTAHLNFTPAYFNSGDNVFPLIDGANNSAIFPTYQSIGISSYTDSPTTIAPSSQFGSLYKMTAESNNYRSTYGYSTTACRLPLTQAVVNSLNDTTSSKNTGLSYVIQNSKTETMLPQFDTQFAVGFCDKLDTKIDEKLIYIIKIASGKNHVLFLTNIGTVYACGDNTYGQLGNGNTTSQNYPIQVAYSASTIMNDAIDIAAGGNHSMFLKKDGQVVTCGRNNNGQCGTGVANATNILYPVFARLVLNSTTITGICEISAGESHSLFLHISGTVYACGDNYYGQLGDGTRLDKSVGTLVKAFGSTNLTNIRSISAGYYYSVFITNDNHVLSCGDNRNGQLGDRTTTQRDFPVVVNLNSTRLVSNYIDYTFTTLNDSSTKGSTAYGNLVVSGTGTVLGSDSENSFILAPAASTLVSATIEPTSNTNGLIVNSTTTGTGLTISFDIKLQGTVYGNTQYVFALGDPVSVLATAPAASSSAATGGISFRMISATQLSVVLTVNGSIAASQIITSSSFTTTTWTNIIFIINKTLVDGSIGYSAYVNGVINADIKTKTWTVTGSNIVNSLDISTLGGTNKVSFYGSANSHKVANFRIWRSDDINNLKILTDINAVSAGEYHTVFLTNTGHVYACGLNSDGRLGNGTTANSSVPVKVKSSGTTTDLTDIKAISAGSLHTIFLTNAGTVYSCGSNASNQLGTTLTNSFFTNPTILSSQKITVNGVDSFVSLSNTIMGISAGSANSIFLKNDDTVYSCGLNTSGQLGDGTNTSRTQVVQLRSLVALYLDLSNQSNVKIAKIARGDNHTLFLGEVKTQPPLIKVWGCGRNIYGELGLGYVDASNPELFPKEITTLNYKDITDIGGMDHASVFLSYIDGTSVVYTCGFNDSNGRQMDGTATEKNVVFPTRVAYFDDKQIKKINLSWAATLLLSNTGAVYASGYNVLGQLATNNITTALSPVQCRDTPITFISNIIDISTGRHSMFVRNDGTVWGCGDNNYGQLGNNTTTVGATTLPVQVQSVTGGFLQNISKVSCGDYHTLFLTNDGKVYACGLATDGRLGNNASSGNVTRATLIPIDAYITDISANDNYSLFVSEFSKIPVSSPYKTSQLTNCIYACGNNTASKLGMGDEDIVIIPSIIPSLSGVAISNIGNNSRNSDSISVVGASGTAYVWGANTYGQLGVLDTVKRVYPHPPQIAERPVTTTTIDGFHVDIFDKMNLRITKVATGLSHTLFLGTTQSGVNKVYACGLNTYGQLGVNDRINKLYPVEITALSGLGITELAAGYNFSVFLSSTNNRVYACGRSIHGSFGVGTNTADTNYPIVPIEIRNLRGKNIIKIAAGEFHSLFLASDTTVWCCGYNGEGALGINSTTTQDLPTQVLARVGIPLTGVSDIAAGRRHSIFLLNTGIVLTTGYNSTGMLGNGNSTNNTGFPTPVIINSSGVGSSTILKNITKIAAGYEHSLFLSKDGLVYGCGSETYGRLGNGVTAGSVGGGAIQIVSFNNLKISDIRCSLDSSHFLSASRGRVYACGRNNAGQLGDGTTVAEAFPVEVSTFNNISVESLGCFSSTSTHYGVVSTEGKVYLWGENDNGSLGGIDDTGANVNKLYPEIRTVTEYPNMDKLTVLKMSVGFRHTLIVAIVNGITNDPRVFTYGYNNYGQLGDGTTTNRSYPVEITSLRGKNINDVVSGEEHSFFVSYNTAATPIIVDLYGCGRNTEGQLGNGSLTSVSTPVNLTYILQGQSVKKLITHQHTVFLKTDKTAMACGQNSTSQVSIGNTVNQTFPVPMLSSAGVVFNNIHDIVVGLSNTFFIKETSSGSGKGTVWGVGRNELGMLSINSVTNNTSGYPIQCTTSAGVPITNITNIATGNYHTIFLSDEGSGVKYIYSCGNQQQGRLGNGVNVNTNITRATLIGTANMTQAIQNSITSIRAGSTHTLFYSSIAKRLYSCGANTYGQLGDGTTTIAIVPTLRPFFNDLDIVSVANTHIDSLTNGVVFSNGTVSMWGVNDYGQLGVNDLVQRNYPEIMTYLVNKNTLTTTTMVVRVATNEATYDFNINNYPYKLNVAHRVDMSIDNRVVYCYLDGIKSTNGFTLPRAIDITSNPNIRVYQRESKTSQQFGQIKFWTKQITSESFTRASYKNNY